MNLNAANASDTRFRQLATCTVHIHSESIQTTSTFYRYVAALCLKTTQKIAHHSETDPCFAVLQYELSTSTC